MGSSMNSISRAQVRGREWEPVQLSTSEKHLATLVALGCTDDEIARSLGLKTPSVKEQIDALLSRIGGKERVEVLLYLYSEPALRPKVAAMPRHDEISEGCNPAVIRKAS
jgi:DNA-binding NarL/FixJ family response regulator